MVISTTMVPVAAGILTVRTVRLNNLTMGSENLPRIRSPILSMGSEQESRRRCHIPYPSLNHSPEMGVADRSEHG